MACIGVEAPASEWPKPGTTGNQIGPKTILNSESIERLFLNRVLIVIHIRLEFNRAVARGFLAKTQLALRV